MAGGLLLLFDDIATILDDVALLTKVAAKKTAGVLGDDLALNAQQVIGVAANRELPIVWEVAKGSLVNKAILVPAALVLSAAAPWAIPPLLMAGGAYLCFEGCEKIVHPFLHPEKQVQQQKLHEAHVAEPAVDIVALEKSKIRGAIRTDFILSAEIVVITLGTVAAATFMTRVGVLVAIGLLMTVGVYGLVAGIVKLDDLGARLITTPREHRFSGLWIGLGKFLLLSAPYLMKFLSIGGTAAMFLVGGGILAHELPGVHHWIEQMQHWLAVAAPFGRWLALLAELLAHATLGILVGLGVLLVVMLGKAVYAKLRGTAAAH